MTRYDTCMHTLTVRATLAVDLPNEAVAQIQAQVHYVSHHWCTRVVDLTYTRKSLPTLLPPTPCPALPGSYVCGLPVLYRAPCLHVCVGGGRDSFIPVPEVDMLDPGVALCGSVLPVLQLCMHASPHPTPGQGICFIIGRGARRSFEMHSAAWVGWGVPCACLPQVNAGW